MLRVCLDCTAAFAVGVPRCPHCGSERHAEQGTAAALGIQSAARVEEDTMPKITRHGGVSDRHATAAGDVEGGERPSAGSSGETSSEKALTTPATSGATRRSRARKTANRSGQDQTAGSTARSTAGDQADAASETTGSADA